MDGLGHRILAGSTAVSVFATAGAPMWQVAAAAPVAIAFSAGWTSPDVDNTWLLRKLTRFIPGRWDARIFGHRRTLHWWGWPALIAHLAATADLGVVGWAVWAALLGWTSHLVGDFIFGEEPPGIPLAPWWWHIGLHLDSGGRIEKWATAPVSAVIVWVALGHPGTHVIEWAASR